MEMRHQPRFIGNGPHQRIIHFDGIDGRDTQPRQVRHQFEDPRDQIAKARRARQVRAPACQVNAGQHDLVEPARHQARNLIHNHARGHRTRIAAAKRNDAKSTAVIAAILNLNIGARPRAKAVNQMVGGLGDRHDVIDAQLFGFADVIGRKFRPGARVHLARIAQNNVDLRHGGKAFGVGLRGTTRHDQPRIGVGPPLRANILACLAHGLGRDRAGIHDHRIRHAMMVGQFSHGLCLIGVQTTAMIGKDGRFSHGPTRPESPG